MLTVRAEDCASDVGSGETRFDTAELIITITDINDNQPTFLDSPYLAYVMENVIPNGGYVITVKAYDADTPPFNNQVRYFLKEGDADLFRINASTGEISLLRALDREQQAEYTLTLVAMDTGECCFLILLKAWMKPTNEMTTHIACHLFRVFCHRYRAASFTLKLNFTWISHSDLFVQFFHTSEREHKRKGLVIRQCRSSLLRDLIQFLGSRSLIYPALLSISHTQIIKHH